MSQYITRHVPDLIRDLAPTQRPRIVVRGVTI